MKELVLLAEIAGRRCAFRAADIGSVIDLAEITPVPRAPSFVLGLAALRSQALTVIDCRRAIDAATDGDPADIRSPVVQVDGHSYALRLDRVDDVASARGEPMEIPGGFGPQWSRVAHGMIETDRGPALLIDVGALIAGPDSERAAA